MQIEEDAGCKNVQLCRFGNSKCDDSLQIIQTTKIQFTLLSKHHIIDNEYTYSSSTIIPVSGVVVKNLEIIWYFLKN